MLVGPTPSGPAKELLLGAGLPVQAAEGVSLLRHAGHHPDGTDVRAGGHLNPAQWAARFQTAAGPCKGTRIHESWGDV